ncbi:MAG TPA: aminotransferase class I/II-fold pyridoxal phosphate-dependent enzyme [Gammaproteobacteria bacterium]|jgi:aspartate aminotransferase
MARKSKVDIHLNLNVRGLSQSSTLAINERSAALQAEGKQVFRLGLGQSPFPVPQPVTEELRANAYQRDYLPVRGLPRLREAVAEFHRRTDGIGCTAADVLIGPGSKELMFLLQLVYYGDLVIPTPSWVSYAPQAQIIGRQIRWVPAHAENDWRLTPSELDKICRRDPSRPRIVVLNYPSNPTGDSYTMDELRELARIARLYRVILLSDEIYGELHHRGQHVSIGRFYPEGTIISSGLSKWCGAGGWRLGTFTFPVSLRWLLDAMAIVASETFTSTSAPIQYAAVRAFEGGIEIEQYLDDARRILRYLGRHLWRKLRAEDVHVCKPAGGFYLFPDFGAHRDTLKKRGIRTSNEFCERLLEETGVAVLPGTDFGRPPEELTLRLAYVDFDGAKALVTARQHYANKYLDNEFLESCCPSVIEATTRMCDWLRTGPPPAA